MGSIHRIKKKKIISFYFVSFYFVFYSIWSISSTIATHIDNAKLSKYFLCFFVFICLARVE